MASVARQPFAPLDGVRLQNLTSIKNRQNAITPNSSTKRKASLIEDTDDFENVDPAQFSKRSKGLSSFFPNKEVYKSAIVLTAKASSPATASTPLPLAASSRPVSPRRSTLNPKSPSKFSAISKSSPLVPPARSPPRSRRSGLLSSRRRSGPYSRIDPPRAASAPSTPFSLDAALKGTIPSYAARSGGTSASYGLAAGKVRPTVTDDLTSEPLHDSWFFDIHEDTPEQEMTNLLQHSTCVLDISSDEETESKRRREKDEGRDKENIPPADDISQTSSRLRVRPDVSNDEDSDMLIEQKLDAREALREMDVKSFFPDGCDELSIFIVPGDEDAETVVDENEMHAQQQHDGETRDYVFAPDVPAETLHDDLAADNAEILVDVPSVEELMRPSDMSVGPKASVLQPVEGTRACETFELWESGSAKDENEIPVAC